MLHPDPGSEKDAEEEHQHDERVLNDALTNVCEGKEVNLKLLREEKDSVKWTL